MIVNEWCVGEEEKKERSCEGLGWLSFITAKGLLPPGKMGEIAVPMLAWVRPLGPRRPGLC